MSRPCALLALLLLWAIVPAQPHAYYLPLVAVRQADPSLPKLRPAPCDADPAALALRPADVAPYGYELAWEREADPSPWLDALGMHSGWRAFYEGEGAALYITVVKFYDVNGAHWYMAGLAEQADGEPLDCPPMGNVECIAHRETLDGWTAYPVTIRQGNVVAGVVPARQGDGEAEAWELAELALERMRVKCGR